MDKARAAAAIEEFLAALGHPSGSDPELTKTSQLVADAWASDLLSGYGMDPAEVLAETLPTSSAEVVALRNVQTCVMCPHHLLPGPGVVHLAYAPGGRIVGLGTLSRLVHCFARRLTLQEALVQNVVDALVTHLGAKGAACVADLTPTCITARGDREPSARVVTLGTAGNMRPGEALHETVIAMLK